MKFIFYFLFFIAQGVANASVDQYFDVEQLAKIARKACIATPQGVDVDQTALNSAVNIRPISAEQWRGQAAIRWYVLPNNNYIKSFRFVKDEKINVLIFEFFENSPQKNNGIASYGVFLNESCKIVDQRSVLFSKEGKPLGIKKLNPSIVVPTLNPEVPNQLTSVGIPVALVDSGVNYLLPKIKNKLLHDVSGKIIGKDYSDNDNQPFDEDYILGSLWFPLRHGTSVASILLSANNNLTIAPYRHPATRPEKYRDLIQDVVKNKIRIVNISIGGGSKSDWNTFYESAREARNILFVLSAGNDGVNLDANPRYPASYMLPNAVVVAASTADGKISRTSNFGKSTVDLSVSTDQLSGFTFDGKPAKLSGTSYAAPVVAAIAAEILLKNPDMEISELKSRIFEKAQIVSGESYTKYGNIKMF